MTSPKLAIFRVHGRNAKTWDKKGLTASSERFDYEYQEAELREFVPPVHRHVQRTQRQKEIRIRSRQCLRISVTSTFP